MNKRSFQKNAIYIVCIALLVSIQSGQAVAQGNVWKIRLSPMPVSFGTRNTITGIGEATATLTGNNLQIKGNYSGMQGRATTAALHIGAKGIPGPAIIDITLNVKADGKNGQVDVIIPLNADQLTALKREQLYLQIASESATEGNLRGWLLR